MRMLKAIPLLAIITMPGLFGVVAAEGGQAQHANPMQLEISDREMERLARTQLRIARIQEEFTPRLKEARDEPERARALQLDGHQKIVRAVQHAGLDVETFKLMMRVIPRNPELRERFLQAMEEQQAGPDTFPR